jgi:hypothetical protein
MKAEPQISKELWDQMPPFQKGYAVYMFGARSDEPNVPAEYVPAEHEREQFKAGGTQAMLHCQDSEE